MISSTIVAPSKRSNSLLTELYSYKLLSGTINYRNKYIHLFEHNFKALVIGRFTIFKFRKIQSEVLLLLRFAHHNNTWSHRTLSTDMTPSINPKAEIDDPSDEKPSEWDDKEKIPDPVSFEFLEFSIP